MRPFLIKRRLLPKLLTQIADGLERILMANFDLLVTPQFFSLRLRKTPGMDPVLEIKKAA
jgi:hypothetical protein